MRAARENRTYMSTTTNARSAGSSSIETAKSMIMAKSDVVEKQHHKGLYS
jgi:hypothetical protein